MTWVCIKNGNKYFAGNASMSGECHENEKHYTNKWHKLFSYHTYSLVLVKLS